MNITLFTSNQPRHIALAETLAPFASRFFVVQECTTAFPGQVEDFFRKSPVMQDYFSRVMAAERRIFGPPRFLPAPARSLSLRMGDLAKLPATLLADALDADLIIVFGASWIRGDLCQRLLEKNALNIHMGLSPFYRGSSCNFWALYDRRASLVGATLHRLSAGLDSGPMLFHALPPRIPQDPFDLGMRAVQAAHAGLAAALENGSISTLPPIPQDRALQLRYTRNADFNDDVAAEYLARLPSPDEVLAQLRERSDADLLHPFTSA